MALSLSTRLWSSWFSLINGVSQQFCTLVFSKSNSAAKNCITSQENVDFTTRLACVQKLPPFQKKLERFFIVLFSEGRGPSVHCTQTTPNDEYLYRCLHGGRKIVAPRRSWKADHPGTICFLYSVYMQKDLLIPSARIFLVLAVADLGEGSGGLGLLPFFRPN